MRTDFYYPSQGAGQIHGCRWMPEGQPKGILQIVHGIAEFVERYDEFANFLTANGFAVVAEDHMGHGQSISAESPQGYFTGGWFTAVEDTLQLAKDTMAAFPGVPYILFGHSMGSFMTRTLLAKYPDSGISAAISTKVREKICFFPAFRFYFTSCLRYFWSIFWYPGF